MDYKVSDTYLKETLSFWTELSKMQKERMKESMKEKHFAEGEFMRSGSDNCSGLFLLISGQVRAYIISDSGKEITLYRLFERCMYLFSFLYDKEYFF